jgi:putative ABC transport system permease protein
MTGFGFALANLRRRSWRSLLMMIIVAVSIAVATVTIAAIERISDVERLAAARDDQIVVRAADDGGMLPFAWIERVRKIPSAEPVVWMRGFDSTDEGRYRFSVHGLNDRYPDEVNAQWFKITPEVAKKWREDRQGAIVGIDTLQHFGWKEEQTVTISSPNGPLTVKVVGIATGYASRNVVVHYELIDSWVSDQGLLRHMWVRGPRDRIDAMAKAIDDEFLASDAPTRSVRVDVLMESFVQESAAVPNLLSKVGLLILVVTGFITASALAMSLEERRSELAIMRAIGFSPRWILALVVGENLLLCTAGGILGALAPYLLYRAEGIRLGDWVFSSVVIRADAALVGLLAALLLGVVGAVVPAIKAMKRSDVALLMRR